MDDFKVIVVLHSEKLSNFNPEEFNYWSIENNIEWDCKTGMLHRTCICFKKEEDAILFRLRFGV